jgi:hypothetical protein
VNHLQFINIGKMEERLKEPMANWFCLRLLQRCMAFQRIDKGKIEGLVKYTLW